MICTAPDLPSLSWRNARNGGMEGLDADMGRAIAARLGVRPVFVETLPGTVIAMLERGSCDLGMGGLGISPARAMRVSFTKPFLAGPMAAVTQRSSRRVPGWAGMDREGVVVTVLAGSVAEEVMRQHLRKAELLAIGPPLNPEQEIAAGRADVFVTDHADSRRLREDDAWRVTDAPRTVGDTLYAYAVPRGDAAWLAEVNGLLTAVKGDGTLLRAAQRWGLREMLAD
ncbi:MAG TPA: ABC transporter substrate-binding protein [Roseomonas sp.]